MKYNVNCYKAGSFKIWKDIEIEADSKEEAEDIANNQFWASQELVASNEEVEVDVDTQYSEFIASEL